MVTFEQAQTASRFTFVVDNPRNKHCGERRNCRRTGKTQTWKTKPGHFKIPVKFGLYESFYITHENAADFEVGSI